MDCFDFGKLFGKPSPTQQTGVLRVYGKRRSIQRNTALLNRISRWRIVYSSLFYLLTANADLDLALGLC